MGQKISYTEIKKAMGRKERTMKNTWKKAGRVLLILLAVLALLGAAGYLVYKDRMKTDRELQKNAELTDAVLYTLEGTELEYNVICYGDAAGAVIRDESGSGIGSLEDLARVLGRADAPAEKPGTDPGERTLGMAVTADIRTDGRGNITELTVKTVRSRPVIGITWKMDRIAEDYKGFAEAFERNGAIAVYLPLVISEDHAEMVLSRIDGLFVTGGEDWNPKLYGQEPTAHGSVDCNDIRDASDLFLIRGAIAMDIPMLTVCRGTQGLNIALGGSLIQDVPTYLGQKVLDGTIPESRVSRILSGALPAGRSRGGCGCEGESHLRVQVDGLNHGVLGFYHSLEAGISGVGIDRGSKWLRDIYGSDSLQAISTSHHQALDPENLGEGLTVAASGSDGIIEAVEYRDNTFVLGLQWHPEQDALADTRMKNVSQDQCNRPLRALVVHAADRCGA